MMKLLKPEILVRGLFDAATMFVPRSEYLRLRRKLEEERAGRNRALTAAGWWRRDFHSAQLLCDERTRQRDEWRDLLGRVIRRLNVANHPQAGMNRMHPLDQLHGVLTDEQLQAVLADDGEPVIHHVCSEPIWVTILRDGLQQIVDADPSALDAQRVASKALGDSSEFVNTGTVRWRPPGPVAADLEGESDG